MSNEQMRGVVFGTLSPVEKVMSYRMQCNACDAEYLVPSAELNTARCTCEAAKQQQNMMDQAMPTLPADEPKKTVTFKRLTEAERNAQQRAEWKAAKARSIV